MQKSALQQNEANRLQHQLQLQQQQQTQTQVHQHLQQQQQQIALNEQQSPTTDIIATNINDLRQTENITRKSKLEQRELLVENHLNSACFAQVHHHNQEQKQQLPIAQQQSHTATLSKPATIAHKSIQPTYITSDCYQQRRIDCGSSVKLFDLSTSPPSLHETVFRTQPTLPSTEVLQDRSANNSQQRYSFASEYSSRSSSSEDSSSLSLTTAATASGSTARVIGQCGIVSSNNYSASHNSSFDDAAENFIINFPADTSPLPTHSSNSDCCLPLSETEPLLTNIEATVNDKQRSIYLNKNSASLIFTRKDLSATAAHTFQPKTASAYHQEQQKQFKLQSKANNNFNRTNPSSAALILSSLPPSSSLASKGSVPTTNIRRQNHSTLRSFSEENYKRKPTKHLPATYHQQHRRSLQLNYNNNLVTTTTCGTTSANNNHYHCGSSSNSRLNGTYSLCCSTTNTNSAVLHKTHHNNHNLQQQQQLNINRFQQHQEQPQHKNCNSNLNTNCTTSNNTAATTRKQYAYSWYAPVYSALEEELEQDSRVSNRGWVLNVIMHSRTSVYKGGQRLKIIRMLEFKRTSIYKNIYFANGFSKALCKLFQFLTRFKMILHSGDGFFV